MTRVTYLRPSASPYQRVEQPIQRRFDNLIADADRIATMMPPDDLCAEVAGFNPRLNMLASDVELRISNLETALDLAQTAAADQRAADAALIAELTRQRDFATSETVKARQEAMSWQARCEMAPVVVPFRGARS